MPHCHEPAQPETCAACAVFAVNPEAAAWSAGIGKRPAPKPRPTKPLAGCVHFGAATGETITCPSCRGTVALKVFACAVHGTCTPGKQAEGVACCVGCTDRKRPRVEGFP